MTCRIDQLLAGFADGDAISHEALLLRDLFRGWGHASDIFVDLRHVSPTLVAQCRPLGEHAAGPADIAVYHYGIASPASDAFLATPARRILVYHNITPARFFQGFDDDLVRRLADARGQLVAMARNCAAVWAVSRFNAQELEAAGLPNVRVFPLPFFHQALDVAADPMVSGKFVMPLKTILFVGRLAPNKRVEDLIQAFAWYHRAINPYSRLVIVGSSRSAPRYHAMLRMLVGDLDLPNVCFEGFASDAGLVAYYQAADVYVSPSEHEGYCLPLVEAMYKGVPVISRRAGGTPEALDGAGVLYDGLSHAELAVLIHRVIADPALRQEVLQSQQRRVQAILARRVAEEARALLAGLL